MKVSGGIIILTCNIDSNLIGMSDETSSTNTGSTSTYTCFTVFKHANVINLTCWFDQIDVGTTMVPIENNPSFVANIKSSFLSNIP